MLIVNEIQYICDVITEALQDEPDIEVIDAVPTIAEAMKYVPNSDVVLVSTRLRDNGAIELTEKISEQYEETKILAMGLPEKYQTIERYIEAGADGIIDRNESMEDVVDHIHASHRGKAYLSPDATYRLMTKVAEYSQLLADIEVGVDEISLLTPRESEILELIGKGFSNQRIADQLHIELGTVKNHVHSVLNKLDVNSRVDAAAYLAVVKSTET